MRLHIVYPKVVEPCVANLRLFLEPDEAKAALELVDPDSILAPPSLHEKNISDRTRSLSCGQALLVMIVPFVVFISVPLMLEANFHTSLKTSALAAVTSAVVTAIALYIPMKIKALDRWRPFPLITLRTLQDGVELLDNEPDKLRKRIAFIVEQLNKIKKSLSLALERPVELTITEEMSDEVDPDPWRK